jgi:acyl dehydratase
MITREEMAAMVGQHVGTSRWYEITQDMIDAFAGVTRDHQFIHVDPGRAAATPFGGTIAHGFLTLSLLSTMSLDAVPQIEGAQMGVNYGFDRVRFIAPVRSGARIRGRFTLAVFEDHSPREIRSTFDVSVEIEGEEKPALAALWLSRRYF